MFYPDFREDMAEMAKQQAVNLWVQEQSSFQCSFGQPNKNAMEIINMAEKSNEERNQFEIVDTPENQSNNIQYSFAQTQNLQAVGISFENFKVPSPVQRHNFEVSGSTSHQVESVTKSKFIIID